jgi:tight adherence protein B
VKSSARLASAAALTALVVAVGVPVAATAADSSNASISSVKFADGQLTGVITVRGSQADATIDAGTVRAKIGGTEYPVSLRPAAKSSRGAMLVVDTSGSMG